MINYSFNIKTIVIFSFLLFSTNSFAKDLPLNLIQLPEGFQIEIYAENIENARSLELTPNGTLFVGNRTQDKVYALVDLDNDFKIDKKYVIAEKLTMPNGVAFRNGHLYVSEYNKILRFDNIEDNLSNPPKPKIINDKLPNDGSHGWKFIRFGPDDKLYIPIGAPCNICEKKDPIYASIHRMNPDGSELELFASGVRNSVGFDWDPVTNELWFTDNGRDNLGDNIPPDELNHAPTQGMHFGYPYCHGKNISDPKYGKKYPCSDFTPVKQPLGAHVASLGMKFYTGKMFPEKYQNQIFIAEHGSWNRSTKVGYKISLVTLDKHSNPISYETFAEGWLQGDRVWGRPVDLEIMSDGSLLVSDDYSGTIYRIFYLSKKKE
jgi:glucose/arabinose dehydrogenase